MVLLCLAPSNPHSPLQLLEVNKQWDQHFRSMKQQYEQKVVWELWEAKAAPGSQLLSAHPPAQPAASFSAALNLGQLPSCTPPSASEPRSLSCARSWRTCRSR